MNALNPFLRRGEPLECRFFLFLYITLVPKQLVLEEYYENLGGGEGAQRKIDTFMLDPEMIEDTVRIVNEAIEDKIQVNLIINNPAGGAASPPGRLEDHRPGTQGEAAEIILNSFLPTETRASLQ